MSAAKLAVLFWFYRDLDVCQNRLRHIRKLNPDLPVFGLYGGPIREQREFEEGLPGLDDFWAFDEERTGAWKWRNGDRMISRWYRSRGESLDWDTIVVIQWDALVTVPLRSLVDPQPDEVVLTGLRPVEEVEPWWGWTRGARRREYEEFVGHLRAVTGFDGVPLCCLFIVAWLPRSFLSEYARIQEPELGFLEYKLPTYAAAFGHPIRAAPGLTPHWASNPETSNVPRAKRFLNAVADEVSLVTALRHRDQPVFHPYRLPYPVDPASAVACLRPRYIARQVAAFARTTSAGRAVKRGRRRLRS